MRNFSYYNPTQIIFGRDRMEELNKLVPTDAKVLVLYGGGSAKQYGTLDKVISNLAGRSVLEFGGIEPNPQYKTLIKAVEIVKNQGISFLIAVGGGSVIDGTKFIALAAEYSGTDASDILLRRSNNSLQNAIPLGTVLTLPATGSEMNCNGVISYENGKFPFGNKLVYPKFSILDPTLTYTLPADQVANGIVDTFVHTTEQYITFPVEGRFQDRTAEGILQTLIEIGPKTIATPTDYEARANLVWCATMGLNGLIGAGVPQDWTSHMIGHEITAMFGIDHGKTLAVIAPAVWTVLKEQKQAKLLQYAERIWNITGDNKDHCIEAAIQKTRDFFTSLGIKTHLADYGVTSAQIEELVTALEQHGMTKLSETGAVTLEVSRKIIEEAM